MNTQLPADEILAAAIDDEAKERVQAEADAEKAQASALRRAKAVARVVELCNNNQTEAAKLLGIDQSRVSRLTAKAASANLTAVMQEAGYGLANATPSVETIAALTDRGVTAEMSASPLAEAIQALK